MPLRQCCLAGAVLGLIFIAAPAGADVLGDFRHAFKTDIPNFFHQDLPCTFGRKPAKGAKCPPNPQPANARQPTSPTALPREGTR